MSRPTIIPWLMLAVLARSPAASAEPSGCDEALALAEGGDLARAHLSLEVCLEANPEHGAAERARRAVRRGLEDGDFARVTIATVPDGGTIEIESLDAALRSPAAVWLSFGEHRLRATLSGHQPASRTVEIDERVRMSVILELDESAEPGAGEIDFGVEAEAAHTAPDPQGPEHQNLLPDRFGSGPRAEGAGGEVRKRPRWPFVLGALGLAALGAGAALHRADRERLGTGSLVAGGASLAVSAAAVVLRW